MGSEPTREPGAGDELSSDGPLGDVYTELRRIADGRLRRERPGQTLQATALVHEAYMRIHGDRAADGWRSNSQFVAAASEAMRRILIENARRRGREKRGGGWHRQTFEGLDLADPTVLDDALVIDDAMQKLAQEDERCAAVVQLRFYCGLDNDEIAEALGVSARTVRREWEFARAWLGRAMKAGAEGA